LSKVLHVVQQQQICFCSTPTAVPQCMQTEFSTLNSNVLEWCISRETNTSVHI